MLAKCATAERIWVSLSRNMARKASSRRPRSPSSSVTSTTEDKKEGREQAQDWPGAGASASLRANRDPRLIVALTAGMFVVVTLGVFWSAGQNDFVNYDDPDYVTSNPHVQGGFTWENVKWVFSTGPGHASNWHPVTWLSHMLDYSRFKGSAKAHHLMNVGLHAANAALLFVLLWRLTASTWRSAFVAALFAWHQLQVESVGGVSERKDVLSAFFFFLTLLAWVGYVRRRDGLGAAKLETRNSEFETNSKSKIPKRKETAIEPHRHRGT